MIVLGSDGAGDREHFRTVESVGKVDNALARGDERFEIYLCKDLNRGLQEAWPAIKKW